jgi:hypothetical protein
VTRLVEALERLVSWRPPIEVGPIVAGYYRGYAELDPGNARRFRDLERFLQTDKDFRHAFISDPGAAALVRDTLTPTVLHASSKTNVVPATAWAEVDSRLLPGHECEKFLDMVRARVADVPQVRIDPAGASSPPPESPLHNDLTAAVERLAAGEGERAAVLPGLLTGFTDSHWFRERGIAAYGFRSHRSHAGATPLHPRPRGERRCRRARERSRALRDADPRSRALTVFCPRSFACARWRIVEIVGLRHRRISLIPLVG